MRSCNRPKARIRLGDVDIHWGVRLAVLPEHRLVTNFGGAKSSQSSGTSCSKGQSTPVVARAHSTVPVILMCHCELRVKRNAYTSITRKLESRSVVECSPQLVHRVATKLDRHVLFAVSPPRFARHHPARAPWELPADFSDARGSRATCMRWRAL